MTNYLNQIVALWGIYMTLLYIDDFCLKYCMSTVYCEVQSFPYVLKVSVSLSSSIENNKPKMYFQTILFFTYTCISIEILGIFIRINTCMIQRS